jgi:hypothetical protein
LSIHRTQFSSTLLLAFSHLLSPLFFYYKPTTTAAPAPNKAAIPKAPLGMPPNAAAVIVLALGAVVVALIPDVNGTFEADETLAKATAC